MTDVARQAGVALGTVSNTLNNPDKVSDATRRRVLAAIAELGFVRNDAARSLAAGSSTTVGLVLADLDNSFFVDIARGAETILRQHGMNLLIANTDVDPAREQRNLELFEESRVAGILITPTPWVAARRPAIRSTPLVYVNAHPGDPSSSGVVVDERRGGYLAARHLIDLGRTRLLFVGGPFLLEAVAARRDGAQQAVEESRGVSLEVLETRGLNIPHGRQAGREIVEGGAGRVDGIIAASDLMAIGCMQVFDDETGFDVPADIAITGYDNNHFASESATPVSTIAQPGEEMGRAAAQLLINQITAPESAQPRTVTLEPHLIARRSTLGEAWRRD
ncbi:LacI family DNA-binding transcriptional regulator [Agromyces subbeticus]|uniref:LacI family DNA-binding transcriptional regulator n=1 Tax=Agromyces subbeticus TaxID=293890 RepID=UPI0003B43001|nr:LacI family DNA-binding transcriptional regulator [Agromyces subbeticus]